MSKYKISARKLRKLTKQADKELMGKDKGKSDFQITREKAAQRAEKMIAGFPQEFEEIARKGIVAADVGTFNRYDELDCETVRYLEKWAKKNKFSTKRTDHDDDLKKYDLVISWF